MTYLWKISKIADNSNQLVMLYMNRWIGWDKGALRREHWDAVFIGTWILVKRSLSSLSRGRRSVPLSAIAAQRVCSPQQSNYDQIKTQHPIIHLSTRDSIHPGEYRPIDLFVRFQVEGDVSFRDWCHFRLTWSSSPDLRVDFQLG